MMESNVTKERSEKLHKVKCAASLNNQFAGIKLPQNPEMAPNNWNGSHQDSYCSESVDLHGPTSSQLRVISKRNPYGFTPIMGCNSHNQMIGMSFNLGLFYLIVFDTDCNILTANITGQGFHDITHGSFAGGYFYIDNDGNSIAVGDNKLVAYPTSQVAKKDEVYALKPLWKTTSVVRAVTGHDDNVLYSSMPVWGKKNLYWCLLGGKYLVTGGNEVTISKSAYIAVVQVTPTSTKPGPGMETTNYVKMTVLAKKELNTPYAQYNNNTFAATEEGAVFVTNGLAEDNSCTLGYCYLVSYASGAITVKWQKEYPNSGFLKTGQKNVGSGTTPTIMVDQSTGKRVVVITDNALPRMNVVAYDYDTGDIISQTPVFSKMRSANEASVIGVDKSIYVPNNFGHTVSALQSQYVANEPGLINLTLQDVASNKQAEVVWDQAHYTFFAMSMLARKSGIIFAHSGEWYDEESATEGPVYYILAIDSFDGRVIWRIPIGRGPEYCHEYGGIYFDRVGDKIFMGTNRYLISVQNSGSVCDE